MSNAICEGEIDKTFFLARFAADSGATTFLVTFLLFGEGKRSEVAATFREECSRRHGVKGRGYAAIKTANFSDPRWQAAPSDKELVGAIGNGVKATGMGLFEGKLNPEQIHALLKYIRSLGAKASKQLYRETRRAMKWERRGAGIGRLLVLEVPLPAPRDRIWRVLLGNDSA